MEAIFLLDTKEWLKVDGTKIQLLQSPEHPNTVLLATDVIVPVRDEKGEIVTDENDPSKFKTEQKTFILLEYRGVNLSPATAPAGDPDAQLLASGALGKPNG